MAVTRKFLESMGLNETQVSAIIEEHSNTISGLTADRDKYKADADRLPGVQKELDDLKKNGGDWQRKYEDEKNAHDKLKQENADKAERAAKEAAFRQLLRDCEISEKRFDVVVKSSAAVIDSIKLDKDGKPTKADELMEGIKKEWDDFITTTTTTGAKVEHPPATSAGAKMSKADIYKKDEHGRYVMSTAERQKALVENQII